MPSIHLNEIFLASPIIYSVLGVLSVIVLATWLHSMFYWSTKTFMPAALIEEVQKHLEKKKYASVIKVCKSHNVLSAPLLATMVQSRNSTVNDIHMIIERQSKLYGDKLSQRLTIIRDIATISPMFGLLGTMLGMFYAFYDMNSSIESINTLLFGGFGVAVGTSIAGFAVAILSTILHAILKYRLRSSIKNMEKKLFSIAISMKKGS